MNDKICESVSKWKRWKNNVASRIDTDKNQYSIWIRSSGSLDLKKNKSAVFLICKLLIQIKNSFNTDYTGTSQHTKIGCQSTKCTTYVKLSWTKRPRLLTKWSLWQLEMWWTESNWVGIIIHSQTGNFNLPVKMQLQCLYKRSDISSHVERRKNTALRKRIWMSLKFLSDLFQSKRWFLWDLWDFCSLMRTNFDYFLSKFFNFQRHFNLESLVLICIKSVELVFFLQKITF